MDGNGERIVGSVLGPLNQGDTITLDCLVTGGQNNLLGNKTNHILTIFLKCSHMDNSPSRGFHRFNF